MPPNTRELKPAGVTLEFTGTNQTQQFKLATAMFLATTQRRNGYWEGDPEMANKHTLCRCVFVWPYYFSQRRKGATVFWG